MSERLQSTLKQFGVTPWQLVLAAGLVGFYYGEARPKLDAVPSLTASVAEIGRALSDIRSDVRVQGTMLADIVELKAELKEFRKELSTIEGRLAHEPNYRVKSP